MTAVPPGTTIEEMVAQVEEWVSQQDTPTTLMEMHLDLWGEEADEYTPADHRLMIAVAEALVKKEEGAG
jgi:hypothetical protein